MRWHSKQKTLNRTMLRISFLLAAMFLISGMIYSCNQITKESELIELIKEGAILIDVRSSEEFAEGSVRGAINIPVDVLENNVEKLPTDKHIIVFCKSGNRAAEAKAILEENNITDVINGGSWEEVQKAFERAESEVESTGEAVK